MGCHINQLPSVSVPTTLVVSRGGVVVQFLIVLLTSVVILAS
ncbi:unnamed protein product [Prunus brigantina]